MTRVLGPLSRRSSLRILLGIGYAFAASLGIGAHLSTRGLDVIAHRGFASEAPENTVEAVGQAVERADAVEVDVRRCGSGELVCVHDETLERVAGVPVTVSETDWETLRDLEVRVGPGSSATIPRLEDVLAVVPPDVLVNVELKERGLAADVLATVDDHDGEVLLSSFDADALAAVREHDSAVPLALICRSTRGAVSTAADLECDAIHPRSDLVFRSRLVPRAHRRDISVNAWTIRTGLEARFLALAGVDGVITDRGDVA